MRLAPLRDSHTAKLHLVLFFMHNRYIHRSGSWRRHVPPPRVADLSGGPSLGGGGSDEEEEGS